LLARTLGIGRKLPRGAMTARRAELGIGQIRICSLKPSTRREKRTDKREMFHIFQMGNKDRTLRISGASGVKCGGTFSCRGR
jgi:hypothetical protein